MTGLVVPTRWGDRPPSARWPPRTCGSPAASGPTACGSTESGRSPTASTSSTGPATSTNLRLAAGAMGTYRALGDHVRHAVPVPRLGRLQVARGRRLGARARRRPGPRAHRPTTRSSSSRHAQRPDGYLNTFVQVLEPGGEYRDLRWGHELYCYRPPDPGRRRLAPRARRRPAARGRAPGGRVGASASSGRTARQDIDGHPEIEMALVELYRVTGDRRHLELAARVHRPARARQPRGGPVRGRLLAGPRAGPRWRRRSPATPCGSCTSTVAPSTSRPRRATGSSSTRSCGAGGTWSRPGPT